jgi:hypothetical protein
MQPTRARGQWRGGPSIDIICHGGARRASAQVYGHDGVIRMDIRGVLRDIVADAIAAKFGDRVPREEAQKAALVEMPRDRANGLCCGGGGGRMWLEENTGTRINNRRVQDVIDVNAQTVASACPFCMTMLDDGAKALQVDEKISRKDIAELVAEAL